MHYVILPIALAAMAVAAPALAAERLTDAQFVRASRCLGLSEAKALGEVDPGALRSLVKVQRMGRHVSTEGRAEDARSEARREAAHATAEARAALVVERDGPCQALAAS